MPSARPVKTVAQTCQDVELRARGQFCHQRRARAGSFVAKGKAVFGPFTDRKGAPQKKAGQRDLTKLSGLCEAVLSPQRYTEQLVSQPAVIGDGTEIWNDGGLPSGGTTPPAAENGKPGLPKVSSEIIRVAI